MLRGKFTVIEGLDCSGKTTLQKELYKRVAATTGHKPCITKEPTNSYIGKYIRNIIENNNEFDPFALQYLSVVDRFNHYTDPLDGIVEILRDGTDVISDRGFLSNAVYYGIKFYNDKSYHEKLKEIVDINIQLMKYVLTPDNVLFIDCPTGIILQRLELRRDRDIFENKEDIELAAKVYKDAIHLYNQSDLVNIRMLDGELGMSQLADEAFAMMR